MYFLGSKISSLVFFWVHNIRSMYFFGCKILGSVGPPRHVYTRVPPPPPPGPCVILTRYKSIVGTIEVDALFFIVSVAMTPVAMLLGGLVVATPEFPNTVLLAVSEDTLYRDKRVACGKKTKAAS